jgi:hypothetical protein
VVGVIPISAEARRTVIVRAGSYAENKGGGPLILFKVQNRRVVDLRSYVTVSCSNSDTGERYERLFFIADAPDVRLPRLGRVTRSFAAGDVSRAGTVRMDIEVRGPSRIDVDVTADVGGGLETCSSLTAFRARRGAR